MQISDKFSCLEKCQRGISNIILKEETNELTDEEEFMKAEIYRDRFSELSAKIERLSVKETEKKEVPEKTFNAENSTEKIRRQCQGIPDVLESI
ncbi:hypothetical protein TNCV_3573981 [Trichonephila clavipes]|nr:hypothetical protein TNCV_3573981 [Trichonephila clavipes]